MRHSDLQRRYRFYNREYFENRLPRRMKVRFVKSLREKTMGDVSEDEIRVSRYYCRAENTALFVLLHEMAHLKVGRRYSHGFKFQAEMARLARVGAFLDIW